MTTRVNTIVVSALAMLSAAAQAFASEGHNGNYAFGEPGHAADVTKTYVVEAHDANGDMKFIHEKIAIKKGDTVKFVVTNKGETPHEFTIGDSASQRAHALMMQKDPEMKHEGDASGITLEPGETKEIIWKFNRPIRGSIELACQMPGHYEGGMVSKVTLTK